MGFRVQKPEPEDLVHALVADRRLYLDAARELVLEEGDPRAAYHLCGPGSTVPSTTVRRLGLKMVNGRLEQRPAIKAAEPAEDKQAEKPADKALVSAEDKGGGRKKSSFGRGS